MKTKKLYDKPPMGKPYAHKTMMVSIYEEKEIDGKPALVPKTLVTDNSVVTVDCINQKESTLTIHTDKIAQFVQGTKCKHLVVEFSDDPTPNCAGGVVSLGYYVLRFFVDTPELLNLVPFVVKCKKEHIVIKETKSMRNRPQSILPLAIPVKSEIKIKKESEQSKKIKLYERHNWLIKDNNESFYVVHAVYNPQKNMKNVAVEHKDYTSTFADSPIIEEILCDSLDQMRAEEDRLVNKYINIKEVR